MQPGTELIVYALEASGLWPTQKASLKNRVSPSDMLLLCAKTSETEYLTCNPESHRLSQLG